MKHWLAMVLGLCLIMCSGCARLKPVDYRINKSPQLKAYEAELAEETEGAAGEEGLPMQTQAEEGQLSVQPNDTAAGTETAGRAILQETEGIELHSEDLRHSVQARGIYLNARVAGSSEMEALMRQLERTALNTVVIDAKDDEGYLTFSAETPLAKAIGAVKVQIPELPKLIEALHARGIYVIARCVAFRDPYLAEARPEWALHRADGTVFRDSRGLAWINPYKREVWSYLKEVGEACAAAGFDEVQLDYIRFCTEKGMEDVVYDPADTQGKDKTAIITEFTYYIADAMRNSGVFVSADVFGTIISSRADAERVGQDYAAMAEALDYICPMIYPSHYGEGNFGLALPDANPYKTVLGALRQSERALSAASRRRAASMGEVHQAIVRPWLQGFTASYLPEHISYGAEELQAQIRAVEESGGEEWLFWNSGGHYLWSAFDEETS